MKELFKSAGFIKHSNTAWICHGDEKTHIVDCLNTNSYRKVKILHRQTDDGSFCSVAGTKVEMFNETQLREWLAKKVNKTCEIK